MNLNKVTLIGNLTGDPKTSKLPAGQVVTTFSLATTHRWRDYSSKELKEKVEFHNIVAWRRLGEVAGKYLKKGSRIFLEGRLESSSWLDGDEEKNKRVLIVADNMIMLGKPTRNEEQAS